MWTGGAVFGPYWMAWLQGTGDHGLSCFLSHRIMVVLCLLPQEAGGVPLEVRPGRINGGISTESETGQKQGESVSEGRPACGFPPYSLSSVRWQ